MNNKLLLAIIPLCFGLSCTYSAIASTNFINIKTEQNSLEDNSIILANRKAKIRIRARQKEDEERQKLRHKLHEKIDREIKREMDKPHNRRVSKAEKERIIQEAHDALDRKLDRKWNTLEEYREGKKRDEYWQNDYRERRDKGARNNHFDPRNCIFDRNCNNFEDWQRRR